jgi:hypothetical protein
MNSVTALMTSCNAEAPPAYAAGATGGQWVFPVQREFKVKDKFMTLTQSMEIMDETGKLARCAFFGRNLHSMMPLVPTPARLTLLHAYDQWHSSRVFTPLTSWHGKFRPNTKGTQSQK